MTTFREPTTSRLPAQGSPSPEWDGYGEVPEAWDDDLELSDPEIPPPRVTLSHLAPETLARIFSFLDPLSLSRCAQTCRTWHTLLSQDTTWRAAFWQAFGLAARERDLAAVPERDAAWRALRVAPALRRAAPSWRAEYTQRTALLRRWRKSRMPTILTDPHIARVDEIAWSASHRFVLSLSHGFSVASRSHAHTGKVAKDFLDASGFAARSANGYPNVEFSPATTVMAADAFASRIVWGLRSGDVTLTTIDWRGASARGTVHNRAWPAGHAHRAPVTAVGLAMPLAHAHGSHSEERQRLWLSQLGELAATFATASADGEIRVWHTHLSAPLWVASARSAKEAPSEATRITHLEYVPRHGVIAAARQDGSVVVWTALPLLQLVGAAMDQRRADARTQPARDAPALPPAAEAHARPPPTARIPAAQAAPITHCLVDADDDRVALLVQHAGAHVFLRHQLCAEGRVQTWVFGAPGISPITSVRCDWDVRHKPGALPSALRARLEAQRGATHKFVWAGTASGGLGVWEWDAEGEPYDPAAQRAWQPGAPLAAHRHVWPAMVLEGHHNAITALALTTSLLLAGCEDGTIKVFDVLAGTLVRVFHERTAGRHPARMLASGTLSDDDAARFRVHHIVAADDMLVAAVGLHVLSWRTHKDSGTATAYARPAAARRKQVLSDRGRRRADMEEAVHDGQALVLEDREVRAHADARQRAMHLRLQGDMDDDAALDYALMLSQADAPPDLPDDAPPDDELASVGWLARQDGDSDAEPLSPTLPHAAAPRASGSAPLAVPPRAPHAAWAPSGPSLASSTSSLSSWRSGASALEGNDEWPAISAHSDGSAPRSASSSTQLRGAWALRSPTLVADDAQQSQRSPRLAPVPPLRPDDELDDDLRLALALSLSDLSTGDTRT